MIKLEGWLTAHNDSTTARAAERARHRQTAGAAADGVSGSRGRARSRPATRLAVPLRVFQPENGEFCDTCDFKLSTVVIVAVL